MKLNDTDNIYSVGRVPSWIEDAVRYFVQLLDLHAYKIAIHYDSLPAVNRRLKRAGYDAITNASAAATITDTNCLTASVYFLRPLKQDANAYDVIGHELYHVWMRHNLIDRICAEMGIGQALLDFSNATLDIQERAVELSMNVLNRLGVMKSLADAAILRKSEKRKKKSLTR